MSLIKKALTSRDRRRMEVALQRDPLTALLTYNKIRKLKPGEYKNGIPVDTEDDYDEFGDPWEEENGN